MISDEHLSPKYVHPGNLNNVARMQFGGMDALLYFGSIRMSASSVTGTGPGESFGLYKEKNNGSCGCTSPSSSPIIPKPKVKRGCSISYRSGGTLRQGFSSGTISDKSCF
jgi:hypothetical protein